MNFSQLRRELPELVATGVCRLCSPDTIETLEHGLFTCPNNVQASLSLLTCVRHVCPDINVKQVLLLQLNVADQLHLPLVTIISEGLKTIWNLRILSKSIEPFQVKAALETRASILSGISKFKDDAVNMYRFFEKFPL